MPANIRALPGRKTISRSEIQVPYASMDDAAAVPKVILRAGSDVMATQDLVQALGYETVKHGNFRVRCAASGAFGFIQSGYNSVKVTKLGKLVAEPETEVKALQRGFLNSELYSILYKRYVGKKLPEDAAAFEEEFRELGVAPKSTDRARQNFTRCLREARLIDGTGVVQKTMDLASLDYSEPERRENENREALAALPPMLRGPLLVYLDDSAAWDDKGLDAWFEAWEQSVRFDWSQRRIRQP